MSDGTPTRAKDYAKAVRRSLDRTNGRESAIDDISLESLHSESTDLNDADKEYYDGHRPSMREISRTISRSSQQSQQARRARAASGASASGAQLGRKVTRRDTVLSRIRSRSIPQFTHPLAHVKTTEADLVDFEGPDDLYHPLNWPFSKKVITTLLYGLLTMSATWASSAYSAGTKPIAKEFHVGTQVATLGTTLFLFGFGLGPLLWAPLSEVFGRRMAVMVPMFIAICFSFGSATAKDFQTLMLTRFFGAFFASAPVTNTGGVLGDLFSPATRATALAGYAIAVVAGPALGMAL
jgi:hypothetical protein